MKPSKIVCNVTYCIKKMNVLSFLERKRKNLSLVMGALLVVFGVWLSLNFTTITDVIPEIVGGTVGYALHAIGILPFLSRFADTTKDFVKRTKEEVRFYRRGYFVTNNHSATQCTIEGWKAYRYKATIIAGNRLDKSGFLIDHNSIHKLIIKWVEENQMPSCEVTLQSLCYTIGSMIIEYGVDLKKLGMEMAPVDHKLLGVGISGELEPISKEEGELLQAMPAGAEYWCEF
ncbi:hypothetical protein PANI_CDS0020 [Maribacter phage Panino]